MKQESSNSNSIETMSLLFLNMIDDCIWTKRVLQLSDYGNVLGIFSWPRFDTILVQCTLVFININHAIRECSFITGGGDAHKVSAESGGGSQEVDYPGLFWRVPHITRHAIKLRCRVTHKPWLSLKWESGVTLQGESRLTLTWESRIVGFRMRLWLSYKGQLTLLELWVWVENGGSTKNWWGPKEGLWKLFDSNRGSTTTSKVVDHFHVKCR